MVLDRDTNTYFGYEIPADYPEPTNPHLAAVYAALPEAGSKYSGSGQDFTCPAHDDDRASLGVTAGHAQPVLLKCLAGCSTSDILKALGLKWDTEVVRAVYHYENEDHELLGRVIRRDLLSGKKDYARSPKAWPAPAEGALYRLPELLEALDAGATTVWITEGEKSAEALRDRGQVATTVHGPGGKGANAAARLSPEQIETLCRASEVRLVADFDTPGYKWALDNADKLQVAGVKVRVRRSATADPDDPATKGDDIVEHLAAGYELSHLHRVKRAELEAALADPPPAWDTKTPEKGKGATYDPAEFTDSRLSKTLAVELPKAGTPILFSSGLGWLKWDGKRWKVTDENIVAGVLKNYLLAWFDREVKAGAADERRNHIYGLLSTPRQTRLLKALKAEVAREVEDFDAHPNLLNVQNGVVDLRTKELRPHDPELLLTQIAPVAYLPGATNPSWEKIKRALPDDVRSYLLARLGQAITGYIAEDDKVLMLVGGGSNGKTTFIVAVESALGVYSHIASAGLLTGTVKAGAADPDKMALRGRRLVWIDETAEVARLNTQRVKSFTGVEKVAGRELYGNSYSFRTTHSLFVTTNHEPIIAETDLGTWRRFELIRFPYTYGTGAGNRAKDPNLWARMKRKAVGEAVIAELVDRAAEWYAKGKMLPAPPDAVVKSTEAWRARSDVLGEYFDERLELDSGAFVFSDELLADVNGWLVANGKEKWSVETLSSRIEHHERLGSAVKKTRKRSTSAGYSSRFNGPVRGGSKTAWAGIKFRRPGSARDAA